MKSNDPDVPLPLLTAIVPNYKTPELTKICLSLLHRNSNLSKLKVIVVDNDSCDESVPYLESLDWITLIKRKDVGSESGPEMHVKALDIAVQEVETPFFMVMHTDTFMIDDRWLDYLIGEFDNESVAGVGSWKLEAPPGALKKFFQQVEGVFRILRGKKTRKTAEKPLFLRSHCAVYRTDLFKKHTKGFNDFGTAGEAVHHKLVAAGFEMKFLGSGELGKYVRHLNHATMILNPRPGDRKTSRRSARKRIAKELGFSGYQELIADKRETAK